MMVAAREMKQRALHFLNAVNATLITSATLPPLRAARAGLLPAWAAWADMVERHAHGPLPDLRLRGRADYRLGDAHRAATELLIEAIKRGGRDGLAGLDSPTLFSMTLLTIAAAFHLTRPHAMLEPTAALQQWLAQTDIGDDVPASLFQLPLPALFLRIDDAVRQTIDPTLWAHASPSCATQGIYLFETQCDGQRELTFVPISSSEEEADWPAMLRIVITNEHESLIAHMRRMQVSDKNIPPDKLIPMVEWCAKILLYLQTPRAVRIDAMQGDEAMARMARVGARKAARIERQLGHRYNRIIVGPASLPAHACGAVSPHWRRGHLRMQPHGPQSRLRKLIFIAPMLVRADRLNGESGDAPC